MLIAGRGVPLVVSAPSGTGKTTLCHRVLARLGGMQYSISSTTRAPRGEEKHGRDYDFLSEEAFSRRVSEGAFLEWAEVHRHRYGTLRAPVEEALSTGTDVLFDIDVQGGRSIANAMPDAVLLFVLPPSWEELRRRLTDRATDSRGQVEARLEVAASEVADAAGVYSHWLVNDDLHRAEDALVSLVVAERMRRVRPRLPQTPQPV